MGRLRTNTQAPELINQFSNYLPLDDFKITKNLFIEIGSGKGDFLINQATLNPNNFYLGIEKFATVILKALKKIKRQELNLKNLIFTCSDVANLDTKKFNNKVSKIFLNFSDPWPKKRHEKRRLTSNNFLDLYKKILEANSVVEFKTDNDNLYSYSLETLRARKDIEILYFTNDLYKDLNNKFNKNNIQTEYEKKFVKQGKNINKIIWKYKN